MGSRSILNLTPDAQRSPPRKWGTPEEQYRRLCMLCLLCRYTYYCHETSLITDEQYNRLENLIFTIEDKNREIIHPKSPTVTVGSDCEEDYPRSARMIWRVHEQDGTLDVLPGVIESFMEDGRVTWGL